MKSKQDQVFLILFSCRIFYISANPIQGSSGVLELSLVLPLPYPLPGADQTQKLSVEPPLVPLWYLSVFRLITILSDATRCTQQITIPAISVCRVRRFHILILPLSFIVVSASARRRQRAGRRRSGSAQVVSGVIAV